MKIKFKKTNFFVVIKIEFVDRTLVSPPSHKRQMHKTRTTQTKMNKQKMTVPNIAFAKENGGSDMVVCGKAFYVKERLKKAGARWNPAASVWTLKAEAATQELLAELNTLATVALKAEKDSEKKKQKEAEALAAYYKTPEGKEKQWKDILEIRKTPGGEAAYFFICCKECEVIDWARQHTSCDACGIDGNTFFVRGRLRTGD
jgi:hypothetical protein